MPSALFLSPHLDDVAFSCGGTLIRMVEKGWRVCLCTVFTGSVPNPSGFALECQLDKGLPADVDYMGLRRKEDSVFAQKAGVRQTLQLGYLEAPHRGYGSAADLFAGMHTEDAISVQLIDVFRELASDFDHVLAPQGLGNHVDHLQIIRAVLDAELDQRAVWYRDTPYAIRKPYSQCSGMLPQALQEFAVPIDLARKTEYCSAYTTQVPFQFGSYEDLREQLERFHRAPEGYAEVLRCNPRHQLETLVTEAIPLELHLSAIG